MHGRFLVYYRDLIRFEPIETVVQLKHADKAAAARRQIDLLEELRTHLVAEVVTGKLDVREVASQLPEEPREASDFEDLEEPDYDGGGNDEDTDYVGALTIEEEGDG